MRRENHMITIQDAIEAGARMTRDHAAHVVVIEHSQRFAEFIEEHGDFANYSAEQVYGWLGY